MTRSQRRARSAARRARQSSFPLARPAITSDGCYLAENPNLAKRGAARLAQVENLSQPYAPLTVTVPLTDSRGRRNPRIRPMSYTV